MKSAEEVLEDANFLRDLIKERNAKGFEAEFYDIDSKVHGEENPEINNDIDQVSFANSDLFSDNGQ